MAHAQALEAGAAGAMDLEATPAPWDYNPSSWSQRIPICLIAGVGFAIAAYMALYQWRLIGHVWDPVFGDQLGMFALVPSEASRPPDPWCERERRTGDDR